MSGGSVICVGHICADIMLRPVQSLPEKGTLALVDTIELHLGGCAANAAVVLGKLGVPVAIGGRVGNDAFGRMVRQEFARNGVDTTPLVDSAESPTSASAVMIASDGQRTILHCLGGNRHFLPMDLPADLAETYDWLLVGGIFLLPEFERGALTDFLKTCRQRKVHCCLDTAWDASGRWLDRLEGVLPELEWFLPSLDEARAMAQLEEPEAIATFFHARGAENVLIKLGGDGVLLSCPGQGILQRVEALPGIPVVDTSGAGDAFCAGFVAALSRGYAPVEAARLGSAVAAQCISRVGTTAGIVDWEYTQKLYQASIYSGGEFACI